MFHSGLIEELACQQAPCVEAVGMNVYHLAHVTLREELTVIITVREVLVTTLSNHKPIFSVSVKVTGKVCTFLQHN